MENSPGRYNKKAYDLDKLRRIGNAIVRKFESLGIPVNRKKCKLTPLTKPFRFCKAKFTLTETGRVIVNGCRDGVTKPFTTMELLARVNSHLRRHARYLEALSKASEPEKDTYHVLGGIEVNEETVEVFVDGNPVRLTPIEFKILLLLIRNPGRVFSADEIYERIWNEKAINTDTIMVHIRKIREKIEIDPKNPKYLKVVWGVGYKMERQ